MREWLDTKSVMKSPDPVMTHADPVNTCAELDKIKVDKNKPMLKTKVDSIDYLAVAEIFNRCLPRLNDLSKMTDARKKKVKKFFDEFDLTLERFENYLTHINDKKDLNWMFEKRPMNDGTGRNWQKQKFEYFIGEKCYLSVKENSDE
jgi:hypothetical protein